MAGLLEFAARFGTGERCIEHLAGLRWPGGFVCAGCGGREAWRLKARPRVYEMRDDGARWVLDLAAYEAAPDPRTRMLIFCHPQNPTGRAYSRGELEAVAAFAIRHDLVVVSDEIHADIVYPGNTHIPLASLHPEIAARTITITSATKSFNIPALRCAVMHFW